MSEKNHTPLPWEAQPFGEGEDGIGIVGLPLGGLVAWATMFPTEMDANDPTRAKANAALIVRSVNSLPGLVKALEDIEDLGANGVTAARLGNIAHAALIAYRSSK